MTDTAPKRYPKLDEFGARLKWARERKGLGSAQLSIAAGLSHATVSKIEVGKTRVDSVTAVTAFKLADLTDTDARWLVCGDRDPSEFQSARGAKHVAGTENPRRRAAAAPKARGRAKG